MKPGTLIATVVFVLIALGHALRLTFGLQVTVGTTSIPAWVSALGVCVALVLAFLLLREGCLCRSRTEQHAPQ